MGGIAAIFVGLGIVVLIYALMQKSKVARVSSAPFARTGDAARGGAQVAGEKGAISVEGGVQCAQPLVAPCSGTPCLYYELKVVGEWKEGDVKKSEELLSERRAAAFTLDDGSGAIPVDAKAGGDFEPLEKSFENTQNESLLAGLKNAVGRGKALQFGDFAFTHSTLTKATSFTATERVLKLQPKLFALGKLDQGRVTAPGWRSLILSHQSRDQVLGSAAKGAKMAFIGGGSLVGLGAVLGVISMFISGPATASQAATVEAPPAIEQRAAPIPEDAAPPADSADSCARALRCCEALNGSKKHVCDPFRRAGVAAETCETSLTAFKKALVASHSRHAQDCR